MNLDSNRLYDTIPTTELSLLTNLEVLRLGNNDLTGDLTTGFCSDTTTATGGEILTEQYPKLSKLEADCLASSNANANVTVDCTCCTNTNCGRAG